MYATGGNMTSYEIGTAVAQMSKIAGPSAAIIRKIMTSRYPARLIEQLGGASRASVKSMVARSRPHMPLGPTSDLLGKVTSGYYSDMAPIPLAADRFIHAQRAVGKIQRPVMNAMHRKIQNTVMLRKLLDRKPDLLAAKKPGSVVSKQFNDGFQRLQEYLTNTFGR
jgi:hypothetical protein